MVNYSNFIAKLHLVYCFFECMKLLFGFILILASCKSVSTIPAEIHEITFEEICVGYLYDAGENDIPQGQFIINQEADLMPFKSKNESWCWSDLEFQSFTYILIIDELQGDRSHEIAVSSISEIDNKITIQHSYIVNHGAFPEVMNQPYLLISIPKTEKDIVFNEL